MGLGEKSCQEEMYTVQLPPLLSLKPQPGSRKPTLADTSAAKSQDSKRQ